MKREKRFTALAVMAGLVPICAKFRFIMTLT
jgi:hypothetical protein